MTPRRLRRPPADCADCPDSINERVLGVDGGLACDAPGGPTKIEETTSDVDGSAMFVRPSDCPRMRAFLEELDRYEDDARREYGRRRRDELEA